ncbi:MAG: glycerophosphodiester phosphodiesterase [Gemmatimonadota bacterium]
MRPGHSFFAGAPLLMAHRGGAALAPENTMAAFQQAVESWQADVLEMDVRATRDGVIVVHHDATVERTTDGQGAVADADWSELSGLDAGHHFLDLEGHPSFRGRNVRIPRFEEVLEAFPNTRINVESKSADAAAGLVRLIRQHRAEARVLLAAQYERNRVGARGYRGPWGASEAQIRRFWVLRRLPSSFYTPDADALQIPDRWGGRTVATHSFIRAAQSRNLPVHVWVVDEARRIAELLDWGADGIQSDRLDVLARVLVERAGRPAPPGLTMGV